MKFPVKKPINPIDHKTVQIPCVTEKRTAKHRNFIESGREVRVNYPYSDSDALILEAQMTPVEYHGQHVAVLSSWARDELGVDVGRNVTVDAIGRSLVSSNVRNIGNLSGGELHVFGASSYKNNISDFVSEVLSPQLGGQVIAEGSVTVTKSSNKQQTVTNSNRFITNQSFIKDKQKLVV